MGRHKKNEETAIVPADLVEMPSEQFRLGEAQNATLRQAEGRISATAARIQRIDREMSVLKAKIAESDETRQLKKLKAERKLMAILQRDATSTYNGALEMALAEIPGRSLNEKIRNYQNGNRLEASL